MEFDAAASSTHRKLYIDGNLVASDTAGAPWTASYHRLSANRDDNFCLGGSRDYPANPTSGSLAGFQIQDHKYYIYMWLAGEHSQLPGL